MPEHMEQQDGGAHLRHLTKTDPDPRVRRLAVPASNHPLDHLLPLVAAADPQTARAQEEIV